MDRMSVHMRLVRCPTCWRVFCCIKHRVEHEHRAHITIPMAAPSTMIRRRCRLKAVENIRVATNLGVVNHHKRRHASSVNSAQPGVGLRMLDQNRQQPQQQRQKQLQEQQQQSQKQHEQQQQKQQEQEQEQEKQQEQLRQEQERKQPNDVVVSRTILKARRSSLLFEKNLRPVAESSPMVPLPCPSTPSNVWFEPLATLPSSSKLKPSQLSSFPSQMPSFPSPLPPSELQPCQLPSFPSPLPPSQLQPCQLPSFPSPLPPSQLQPSPSPLPPSQLQPSPLPPSFSSPLPPSQLQPSPLLPSQLQPCQLPSFPSPLPPSQLQPSPLLPSQLQPCQLPSFPSPLPPSQLQPSPLPPSSQLTQSVSTPSRYSSLPQTPFAATPALEPTRMGTPVGSALGSPPSFYQTPMQMMPTCPDPESPPPAPRTVLDPASAVKLSDKKRPLTSSNKDSTTAQKSGVGFFWSNMARRFRLALRPAKPKAPDTSAALPSSPAPSTSVAKCYENIQPRRPISDDQPFTPVHARPSLEAIRRAHEEATKAMGNILGD